MRAGLMRHRITLKRITKSTDSIGAPIESTTSTLGTRWARFIPLSGKESFSAEHELAIINTRFELRHDSLTSAVKASDLVVYDGNTYEVDGPPIDVGGRGIEIHLMCRRVT